MRVDFTVDFLFLVRQENIEVAVFLYQSLPCQYPERVRYPVAERNPVVAQGTYHKACDIFQRGADFRDVFYHKQRF